MPPKISVTAQNEPAEIPTGTMQINEDGDILVWSQNDAQWFNFPTPPSKHPMDIACQATEMWGEIDEKYPDLQSLRDQYIKEAKENEELNRIRAEYDRLHEKYWIFEELKKPYEN